MGRFIVRKENMNTVDKIVNDIAQRLANAIVEGSNYKVFYDEAQEKLVEVQAQLEQAQARLNEVSQTLEADEALKEIFDEVAEKLEAKKLEAEKLEKEK